MGVLHRCSAELLDMDSRSVKIYSKYRCELALYNTPTVAGTGIGLD